MRPPGGRMSDNRIVIFAESLFEQPYGPQVGRRSAATGDGDGFTVDEPPQVVSHPMNCAKADFGLFLQLAVKTAIPLHRVVN